MQGFRLTVVIINSYVSKKKNEMIRSNKKVVKIKNIFMANIKPFLKV